MKPALNLLFISIILFPACNSNKTPMYRSDRFAIYHDRVVQGGHTARASDEVRMTSDYRSRDARIDPVIEFKFSINGRDDELPFGVNHLANILPVNDDTVVIDLIFGKRPDAGTMKDASQPLPANTKVRFRVDFNLVLDSFREKGYYDDILGNRIFESDFRGLYIAGDTYPLNWDFDNIQGNPMLKMEDNDGDGIFEKEITFNVFDPSAHTSASWELENDISGFPVFESSSVLLNALNRMSLDELVMLMEDDGTFRTGKEWPGVWTRDISYATILALSYLDPQRCMNSLMRKVDNGRIIQDTGTGGAWPVSSDRVVWALAAWEVYKYTGDSDWLAKAYAITKNSLEADSKTIFDPATGLIRGESSFLDWRKQTYPLWMEPADIYGSLNLGTNAAYCQALRVTGMMASELGEADVWSEKADRLREAINNSMWIEDRGYYGQYLYGRYYRSLSPRAEALGESFSVIFGIADEDRKLKVLHQTPVTPFGITCIYPQIPGIPPYHNDAIWPFVQAFWTIANAGCRQLDAVEAGLASIIRPAALFLTNKENFVAVNGDFAGTEVNSDRQLWSVAAMLAIQYRVIAGINFEKDRMEFRPVIPRGFSDTYTLTQFRYRNGTFNIKVSGWGDAISSFMVDGVATDDHFIMATMTGAHTVEIVMNKKSSSAAFNEVTDYTAPDTPALSLSGDSLSWNPVGGAGEYRVYRNGRLAAATGECSFITGGKDEPAEYQVMALDSNGVESFLSNPVTVMPVNREVVAEAEDFNKRGERATAGFTGSGYVRMKGPGDGELEVTIACEAGRYALTMRYANGTGPVNTDNNCAIRSVYVNGDYAGVAVFPQRGKDEWADWGLTFPCWIDLKDGINTITVRYDSFNRNMDGQINEFLLDRISLTRFD
jgi:hypothetical protein